MLSNWFSSRTPTPTPVPFSQRRSVGEQPPGMCIQSWQMSRRAWFWGCLLPPALNTFVHQGNQINQRSHRTASKYRVHPQRERNQIPYPYSNQVFAQKYITAILFVCAVPSTITVLYVWGRLKNRKIKLLIRTRWSVYSWEIQRKPSEMLILFCHQFFWLRGETIALWLLRNKQPNKKPSRKRLVFIIRTRNHFCSLAHTVMWCF